MKKILVIILSVLLIMVLAMGCSTKSNESSSEEKKQNEKVEEENLNWISEVIKIKNTSSTIEKYMRSPDSIKAEKVICGLHVIDVKTEESGIQTIYGNVLEPYQRVYGYKEYMDDDIKYIFIKYDPSQFNGDRILQNDYISVGGSYVGIHSDDIVSVRKEGPMFEAEIKGSFRDYVYIKALDNFLSSMGQSVNNLKLKDIDETDTIFNEIRERDEYSYLNKKGKDNTMNVYKDCNDIYWMLDNSEASQANDDGVNIYVANKDNEGKYKVEYKGKVEYKKTKF